MLHLLLILSIACSFSYHGDESKLSSDLESLMYDNFFSILRVKNTSTCILANRGTRDAKDILEDFSTQLSSECVGGVSKTLLSHFNEFRDKQNFYLDWLIEKKLCGEYIAVGHSIGGATIDLVDHKYIVSKFSFGSPKLCCDGGVNTSTTRVINGNIETTYFDPIPSLPLHNNFEHCSSTIKYVYDGHLKCKRSFKVPVFSHLNHLDLHHIDKYTESIHKAFTKSYIKIQQQT